MSTNPQKTNKKILIIGCPGAGKSTFARKLSERTQLPLLHLDKFYHKVDRWSDDPRRKKAEWLEFVSSLSDQKEWIMDGNYTSTLDLRVPPADLVIFLDFPRSIAIVRAFRRLVYFRNQSRPDMPEGWKEQYNKAFFKKIWKFNTTHRPCIMGILEQNEAVDRLIIKSPKQLDRLLREYTKNR